MPAPVVSGLIKYLEGLLGGGFTFWQGEVPRQDAGGTDIVPPAFKATMPEDSFTVTFTTEDPYYEEGLVDIYVWTTDLASCEDKTRQIFDALSIETNWYTMDVGPNAGVAKCLVLDWHAIQLEGVRTQNNELLFEGKLKCEVGVGTSTPTR